MRRYGQWGGNPKGTPKEVDYYFWFWILVAFVVGRWVPRKFYIGDNEQKYNAADCGMLLRRRKRAQRNHD